jgi:hypothetical protein
MPDDSNADSIPVILCTVTELERLRRCEAVLKLCAAQFRAYEQHHLAKPDHEKAATNARFAEMCEAALNRATIVRDGGTDGRS